MPEGKDCAVSTTVGVIGGRWKVLILQALFRDTHRFSSLQREISDVSQKVLTQQLRELEADGIVQRTVYPEVPPRVEYALTDLGRSLWPVLTAMHEWGLSQHATKHPAEEKNTTEE